MLFDTSVWIEYLAGTTKGERVQELLSRELETYTCPLTLSEVAVWCYKNNESPERYIAQIKSISKIIDLSEDILVASGRLYSEERPKNKKIGLIDCIIYTTAQFHGLVLLTKDSDFEGLDGVEMI